MHKNDKRMLFGETPAAQVVMLPYGEAKRVGAFVVLPTNSGKAGLATAVEHLFGSDSAWDQAVDVMGFRPVKLYLPRFKVEYGVKSLKAALADMGMQDAFQVRCILLRGSSGHFSFVMVRQGTISEPRRVCAASIPSPLGLIARAYAFLLPRLNLPLSSALLPCVLSTLEQPNGQFQRMTEDTAYIEDVLHKAVIEVNEEGTVAAAATAVMMTRSLPPPPVELKVDRPFLFVVYDQSAKTVLFVAKVESV